MERKITIEEDKIYQEDYQMRMLQANQIEGLLTVKGRGMDGKSCYDYEVSGKMSVKSLYEKNEMSAEDIKNFLKRLMSVLEETENYLLDIHCILLDPEYIYYEAGQYYFCYYPPGGSSLWEAFHVLTEYFVKRADYKDQSCVQMVFLLHKETMKENYSLEKLAEKCLCQQEQREDVPNGTGETPEEEEGYKEADIVMDEAGSAWKLTKRFRKRHKKPKWGDWDGLYIEEEDLQ